MAIGVMASAAPAHASQNPPACTGNNFDVEINSDLTYVRNGDVMHFNLSAANDRGSACDISAVAITLTLPDANGAPSGPTVVVRPSVDLPAGTHETFMGTVPWTVNVNPGVVVTQAIVHAHGILHRNPNFDIDTGDIAKSLSTAVTRPHMTLSKVANPVQGVAPLTVTYTYMLDNDGDADIASPVVNDDRCSPLKLAAGDANADGVLQTTETWTYTCTQTFPSPGTYVNTAVATGTSTTDNKPVTAGPVHAQVLVTPPAVLAAPPPAAPVVPAAAPVKPSSAPGCISTPKSLSLRARENTTVKVTLDNKLKGVKVTIKGPGINKSATTDSKGVATFTVKPSKSGTLTITTPVCSKASKAAVKAARKTQSRQLPKVTG